MSDENKEIAQKEEPKVASAGGPTRAVQPATTTVESEAAEEESATQAQSSEKKEVEISPEIRAAVLKQLGIEGDEANDIDAIKARLNPQQKTEPTDEEKQAAAQAEEKEMLDLFIQGGGTVENFVAIKAIINTDLGELSRAETIREYKEAGFTNEEAEALVSERYYQVKLDEIEKDEFETEEEFADRKSKLEKKVKFFSDKLSTRAAQAKNQAQELYNNLKQEVSNRKSEAQKEIAHAANAEAYLKTLPRELTLELGKLDGNDLPPVKTKVSEDDIAAVSNIVKSPAAIKQFLFNEDGSFNIANLTDALLARQSRNTIARTAVLEGQTRMTKVIEAQFPSRTPYSLGVGGAANKEINKGKVASAGKPQRV